jgi:hypothetical protein
MGLSLRLHSFRIYLILKDLDAMLNGIQEAEGGRCRRGRRRAPLYGCDRSAKSDGGSAFPNSLAEQRNQEPAGTPSSGS